MIELRWTLQENTPHARPKLQWRGLLAVDASGAFCPGLPSEWHDVQTVKVPREPDERMSCCDGGPQWGHALDCPNAT